MKSQVYLDHAAATPVHPDVLAVMQPYFGRQFYNPSATYLSAKSVADDIRGARVSIARWFGARPTEIIFTSGGTEANNLAIKGVMEAHPGANMLYSAIEHDSVIAPAGDYQSQSVKVDPQGRLDLADLTVKLNDRTVLVSVMYANNEVGTIQPLRQVAQVMNQVRQQRQQAGNEVPLYLHTDACQAANYLDLHANRLGADLISINAGKIYGPKQSGALYVKTGIRLEPQISGGRQESGRRSGTESAAAIVGLAKALDLVQTGRQAEANRLGELRDNLAGELRQAIPGLIINGSTDHRLPNNLHVTIPGQDNERLIMALDEQGFQCAAGSACSASKEAASHVLAAIGLSEADAYSSLRLTMGRSTTRQQLQNFVSSLSGLI